MMGPPCAWLESVKPWWRDDMLRHFDTVSERDRRTDRIPISISLVSIAVLTDDNKHCSVPTAGCCQLVIENNILPASCCLGQVINLVFSGPIPGKFLRHKYTNIALQKRSWPARRLCDFGVVIATDDCNQQVPSVALCLQQLTTLADAVRWQLCSVVWRKVEILYFVFESQISPHGSVREGSDCGNSITDAYFLTLSHSNYGSGLSLLVLGIWPRDEQQTTDRRWRAS